MSGLTEDTWVVRAACRGLDPDIFHPVRAGNAYVTQAKQICEGCSVRAECLEYALEAPEPLGVWGGLSAQERRRIRVERARAS